MLISNIYSKRTEDFQGQKLPEKNYKLKVILGRFNLLKIGWASSNLARPALIESKSTC